MDEMPRWRRNAEDEWHDWPPGPDATLVWLEIGEPPYRHFIRFGGSEQMERFANTATQPPPIYPQ